MPVYMSVYVCVCMCIYVCLVCMCIYVCHTCNIPLRESVGRERVRFRSRGGFELTFGFAFRPTAHHSFMWAK